jgi:hypothetical protein
MKIRRILSLYTLVFTVILLSFKTIFSRASHFARSSNSTLNLSNVSSKFRRYVTGDAADNFLSPVPSWIITDPNVSTIHRFFDSSPFSPSGRYIALTRFSNGENALVLEGQLAQIVLYDLTLGPSSERVIATTAAWDSQVGAQIQWGANDSSLFYNAIIKSDSIIAKGKDKGKSKTSSKPTEVKVRLRGVLHDIFTGVRRFLDCPVYHVSPDGQSALSPDLTKIKYAQLGYGVHLKSAKKNRNAPTTDGVFMVDTKTGQCKLLSSLHDLAVIGGLDLRKTPTYGFHVKWSSDGEMIMFVVRTLEKQDSETTKLSIIGDLDNMLAELFAVSVRTQHLFVMSKDGSNPRRLISWGGSDKRHDGNHPNWIPGTRNISMNLQRLSPSSKKGQRKNSEKDEGIDIIEGRKPTSLFKWEVVVFDVDALLMNNSSTDGKAPLYTSVYKYGTGHPTYRLGGQFLVMDAYAKERASFSLSQYELDRPINASGPGNIQVMPKLNSKSVPLRLVDTLSGKEIWILQVGLHNAIFTNFDNFLLCFLVIKFPQYNVLYYMFSESFNYRKKAFPTKRGRL